MPNATVNLRYGERLRRLRKAAGYTQLQLAEAVDLSMRFLQDLERGQKVPSLLSILRLAKALKTPAATFIEGLEDDVSLPNPKALTMPRVDRRKTNEK